MDSSWTLAISAFNTHSTGYGHATIIHVQMPGETFAVFNPVVISTKFLFPRGLQPISAIQLSQVLGLGSDLAN